MSAVTELLYSRRVPQVAALALISFGFAGCSADTSSRMSQFSDPFAQESTGTVPPAPVRRDPPQYARPQATYPRPQVNYPPPQVTYQPLPPPAVTAPQSYSVPSGGISGGGHGVSSYTPPSQPRFDIASPAPPQPRLEVAHPAPPPQPRLEVAHPASPPPQPQVETTGTVAPRTVVAARPARGTTIIVGTSDTLDVLAKRYHVTPAAILAANGYKGPRALSPGQQLIIPHPTTTVAAAAPAVAAPSVAPANRPVVAAPSVTPASRPVVAAPSVTPASRPVVVAAPASKPVAAAPPIAPASKPIAAGSAPPSVHFVNGGDTLNSIARKNHVSVAELARANGLDTSAKLKLGTRLTVPAAKSAAAPTVVAAAPAAVAKQPAAQAPPQSARLAQATPNIEEKPAAETPAKMPAKTTDTTGALPTFRWPVRGKVVTSYGAKTNGKVNDGINLAVPEGTPVKAAEDGVVAYSGNELKGYGNLILVRHSNGYVTAYAHASELLVKRGDTIKRGQIIAKSGQSGEVGSPQLHFEIRNGSKPVDPLQFLNGA